MLADKHETTLEILAADYTANLCALLELGGVSMSGVVCDHQCQATKTEWLHERVAKHDKASFYFSCGR